MSDRRHQAPKWEEDFPFRIDDDEAITRRDFTRFLVLAGGGVAVGSGWVWARSLVHREAPAVPVDLGAPDELAPGDWRVFRFGGEPALLVRRRDGTFVAYAQKCTHLACPVTYRPATGDEAEGLYCHCHHGRFDLASGRGIGGPPRVLRPLRRIELEHGAGRLVATRFATLTG